MAAAIRLAGGLRTTAISAFGKLRADGQVVEMPAVEGWLLPIGDGAMSRRREKRVRSEPA